MNPFSTQTIAALVEAVTGGSANEPLRRVGLYRTGPALERFFGALNVDLRIGSGSRVPTVRDALDRVNKQPGGPEIIIRAIEAAVDPRDYLGNAAKLDVVVQYLNARLRFDGYALCMSDDRHRVTALATNLVAATALREKIQALDLESVRTDFERARREADSDPASAITAACSTVESVCKCILDEMTAPYPTNKDIKGLVTEVGKLMNLSPGRRDIPTEWEHDIRTILSGLLNVAGGIGALRTHAGDAHGRGRDAVPVDPRIARLAIHAASTISLFFIETWQRTRGRSSDVPTAR